MIELFKNPMAYLSASFVLFIVALPLVSIGATSGPRGLLWLGLVALCAAALIPPVQRLACGSERLDCDEEDADEPSNTQKGAAQ